MTATKIQPGDDTHLSLLMAPHSLNLVTGADRAALLAYGRDVFAAARAGQCLTQIEEPAQPVAPVLADRWKARMLDGRAIERDEMGLGDHPELPQLDEGMKPRSFFAALGLELAHTMAEDQLDGDALEAMSDAVNWTDWKPRPPQGDGWKLVAIFDTEEGPAAWWLRELAEAEDGTTTIRNLQAEIEKLKARMARVSRAGAAPAAVAPLGEYPQLPKAAVWSVAGKDGMPTFSKGWMFSPVQQCNVTLPLFTAQQMWAYHDLGRQSAPAAPALEAPAAPVPEWLKSLEWAVGGYDRAGDGRSFCPRCGGCETDYRDGEAGHKEGCELAALLAAAPLAPAAPAMAVHEYIEGGRESVDDALAIVESFGSSLEGVNDEFARQIILAAEVRRLRGLYEQAVNGRSVFRDAYRKVREAILPPLGCPACDITHDAKDCPQESTLAAAPQAPVAPVAVQGVAQFRKKPITISAIQWTGKNLREVITFTDGPPETRGTHAGMAWEAYEDLVARDGLKIYTLEGKMLANVGDWIIRGVKGEHYPCKPDIFSETYEVVAAPAAPAVDADPLGLRDVGEALMQTIERNADALKAAGWTAPMDCPSEIVVDLLNLLDEANAASALGEWVATLEVDSEGGLDYETVPPCTLPEGCYRLYRAAQAKEGGAAC